MQLAVLHLSRATRELLRNEAGVALVSRGNIDVKGKGYMRTSLVANHHEGVGTSTTNQWDHNADNMSFRLGDRFGGAPGGTSWWRVKKTMLRTLSWPCWTCATGSAK